MQSVSSLAETGQQYRVCESHRVLGEIYRSNGKTEEAIHHFEVALGIASSFDWHHDLFRIYYSLAGLFLGGSRFDDANTHIERAKSHMANSVYPLVGCVMELQARVWPYRQHRLGEAGSEALRAADVFEKPGAAKDVERCR